MGHTISKERALISELRKFRSNKGRFPDLSSEPLVRHAWITDRGILNAGNSPMLSMGERKGKFRRLIIAAE
jgi:hypothetical protein